MSKKNQNKWSQQDDHQLRVLVRNRTSNKEIAKQLNRSVPAVASRKTSLGIIKGRGHNVQNAWTRKDLATLKKLVKKNTSNKVIGQELGRTPQAVSYKKSQLGIKNNPKKNKTYQPKSSIKNKKTGNKVTQSPTPTSKISNLAKVRLQNMTFGQILKTAKKAGIKKVNITFE